MHLPRFEYVKPRDVAHVVTLLGELRDRAAILAGGTDLLTTMGQRLRTAPFVIGVKALPELQGIQWQPDGSVRIGAATTLTELEENPEFASRLPMLRKAINAVASKHVRNVATLAGNLALPTRCWYTNQTEAWRDARAGCFKTDHEACHVLAASDKCVATSSADSVPALIVHGARVTLASIRGQRDVALSDFYRDDGAHPTVLAPDELIVSVTVPAPTARMAFMKVTPREGIDFGLGTIAAAVDGTNRKVRSAQIIVNAIGSRPIPLKQSAQVILDQGLNAETIDAAAQAARADLGEITNLWTPAGYKRRLVRALLKRALDEIRCARS